MSVILNEGLVLLNGSKVATSEDCCCDCTGACCRDDVCTIETESDCTGTGGTFHGCETDCDPNPCACPSVFNFDVINAIGCFTVDETSCIFGSTWGDGISFTTDEDCCPNFDETGTTLDDSFNTINWHVHTILNGDGTYELFLDFDVVDVVCGSGETITVSVMESNVPCGGEQFFTEYPEEHEDCVGSPDATHQCVTETEACNRVYIVRLDFGGHLDLAVV